MFYIANNLTPWVIGIIVFIMIRQKQGIIRITENNQSSTVIKYNIVVVKTNKLFLVTSVPEYYSHIKFDDSLPST